MKTVAAITFLIIALSSCQTRLKSQSSGSQPSDSLKITITSFNLSEDLTGNDELILFFYHYNDTSKLGDPLMVKRFMVHAKARPVEFRGKVSSAVFKSPSILFLLEQDSDWLIRKIDSTLQVSHLAIRREFASRNYNAIEKYLGDEDVLGVAQLAPLTCNKPIVRQFAGIYKLDKFDYQVSIECLF